jgi:cation transport ATPase
VTPTSTRERAPAGYGFGTFKGVFTPSILTILGVVMYLRFPWVLGSVGLARTLLIVTLAVAITLLTALSISAADHRSAARHPLLRGQH